jgi:hypothetical protein
MSGKAWAAGPLAALHLEFGLAEHLVLQRGDHVGDGFVVREVDLARKFRGHTVPGSPFDHVVDHLHEAHAHTVVGVVDALDAVILQFPDLVQRDRPAAAAEHADMARAALAQQVDHVGEELDVAALVGRNRDRVGILLDRRPHDVQHAAVVAKMDDLGALGLDQPAHDIDRGIVAVEQRGRGDEAQRGCGFWLRGVCARYLAGGCAHRIPFPSNDRDCSEAGQLPRSAGRSVGHCTVSCPARASPESGRVVFCRCRYILSRAVTGLKRRRKPGHGRVRAFLKGGPAPEGY